MVKSIVGLGLLMGGFLLGMWALAVFFFAAIGTKPFIYFQF